MKSIKDFLEEKHNSFNIEYWSKKNYLLEKVNDFFREDIPNIIKEKLLNDEYVDYIYENLQSHDTDKLKNKLLKEYGESISFQDYNGDKKKSFIIILNKDNLNEFINTGDNTNIKKVEKFNNILSFFNYYVSYNDEDKGKKYLFIEPRYSDNITNEIFNSHKYIYHFTDKKSGRRILETGLRIRKSNYREYPERIFLYATDKKIEDDKENICKFILKVCNIHNIKRYGLSILRIENNNKFDLYNDTAMEENEAVFTYENIPYQYIKKVNIDITYEDLIKYNEL